jgi:hypothetical protein
MNHASKILCIIGCILLLATAVYHGTHYSGVSAAISESNHPALLKAALPAMWLQFSIHLVVIAALGLFASFSSHGSRSLVSLLAVAVAVDAALILYFVGFFVGVALLAAAAVCFALSALRPWSNRPELRGKGA